MDLSIKTCSVNVDLDHRLVAIFQVKGFYKELYSLCSIRPCYIRVNCYSAAQLSTLFPSVLLLTVSFCPSFHSCKLNLVDLGSPQPLACIVALLNTF